MDMRVGEGIHLEYLRVFFGVGRETAKLVEIVAVRSSVSFYHSLCLSVSLFLFAFSVYPSVCSSVSQEGTN